MPDAIAFDAVAPPAGLYVHVPFCVSICPYCDFVVYAGRAARGEGSRIGRFVEALEVEIGLRADALDARWGRPGGSRGDGSSTGPGVGTGERPPLETLYLGGGTPSLLPTETLVRLIELVRTRFGLADGAEITLEVNPGPDERGDAAAIRDAGVTRLSIGAQSLHSSELRALGRRHAPEDVDETVGAAREAGFESVSLDLLYDVPGQTLESWARSLDRAIELDPDHLSIYALTLDDPDAEGITGPTGDHLPLREGARRWRSSARTEQDEDRAAAMYELADERLAAAGLGWYEVSNWARPGHASRHNLGYWRGDAWEAVGPGAHAYDGATRRWNAARLDGYLAALRPSGGSRPGLPPGASDRGGSGPVEFAILHLRTSDGLPRPVLLDPRLGGALRWAVDGGLLAEAGDRLVLTRRGRLLSNEVFARLL
ncbi:MAG TPA: coproporphyrinogen-III oxidase family protein [Candidatus Limnocylindrales bacterium]|nr:coproporphyrinogen-III oxidase family protein [Candidatus Limnocylindrales bacterium]